MTANATTAPGPAEIPAWWESRWLLLLLPLLAALPLVLPAIPPLTDLPGHMGRYKVALDLANSASLQAFYSFRWALVPNLGADLLVVALAPVFGVEGATKLIVLLIPLLTAAGFLCVSKEAHGRVSPSVLLALPLIYSMPFLYGFINFALSVALAFLAFGLWMRLGRLGRVRLRAALFVPIGLVLWISHAFGWGMLGLLAFGFEYARAREAGRSIGQATLRAALNMLPLAAPLVPMLIWSGQAPGGVKGWFSLQWKLLAFLWLLRDRWMVFDIAALATLILFLVVALRNPRLDYARSLAIPALLLFAAFVLLPRVFLGSAQNDNRLLPFAVAVLLLAVRPSAAASRRFVAGFAVVALAFLLVRMAGVTASTWLYGRSFETEAAALERLPRGARLAAFVNVGCFTEWGRGRLDHLPSLAIVRREAFANDQWTVAGSHLLTVKPPYQDHIDPSHMVADPECREHLLNESLAKLDTRLFDHVWLIRPPAYDPALVRGWTPVWRQGGSVLFRLPQNPGPPVTLP